MDKMERINKHTMLKQARENGTWKGFTSGNNVNSGNVIHCWCLGVYVEIKATKNEDGTWAYRQTYGYEQTLEESEYSMLYYMERTIGTRVVYWQGTESEMAVYSDEN